ncbi:hypothetical protein CFP56_014289 [Quercus suber]|uniref:Uncharacterized protein n=1 Tax=Quercus suber TaxID=58331 RepID=A0AAW0KT24_QUESU
MSGVPKRTHEESGHSSSSKYPHEDSGGYPKLSSTVSGEYHSPYEMGQDARMPKIPRTEPRDADRRSPLRSSYWMQAPLNDSHVDHPENRLELGIPRRVEITPQGKRYPDAPSGVNLNFWPGPRGNSEGTIEAGKEGSATEERDYVEAHEAVGENKVDSKGEEKLKDKDRKRKDVKHRDWGERDKDRSDRRSGMQVANSSSEYKESTKEERDAERWERKDFSKDRERLREREKDHTRRDSWNGVDKESSQNEKELGDGSLRMPEQENPASEQKKQKDFDSWKNVDREARERMKESNDIEGDRTEKRRCDDKESDDGCAEGEGATEREREVYNYGVQQRKRMQRSRGSLKWQTVSTVLGLVVQTMKGKAEVSSVVYKVGECMQELIKLWKEYKASQAEKNGESSLNGPTLEIRIPAEHVTATNRQVRGGQLWGTDIYTDDSDLVAVLMHTGYCRPTASPPPPAIQELRATIRVLPPQDCYISTLRNNVRSRAWGAAIGCSYCVERCCIVKKGGGTIDLEPCLTHTSTVEPTLAPVAVERTMTTRAAASKFSMSVFCDSKSELKMTALDREFKKEIKEAGNSLLNPPSSIDDLLTLLDKVSVLSCIIEITRITTLDAPYKDEQMKEIFQLILAAFENMSHVSTRSYKKVVSILDTIAKNALRQQRFVREVTIQYNLCNEPWIKYSISIVADKGLKKPLYTSARLKKGEVLYLETHSCRYSFYIGFRVFRDLMVYGYNIMLGFSHLILFLKFKMQILGNINMLTEGEYFTPPKSGRVICSAKSRKH